MNEIKVSKGDKKNIILERRKPKNPQKENPLEVDGRDTFQTPNYATEIIIPFLASMMRVNTIWECAAGLGKISNRLLLDGFDVLSTDLAYSGEDQNFLTCVSPANFDAIVTNPPFSLKRKFFDKCVYYSKPFALLIPADYSGWIIDAVKTWGCEKIIPTRRIDYITPNILRRIWEGEVWEIIKKEKDLDSPLISKEMYIDSYPMEWQFTMAEHKEFKFESIYDAPAKLLRKYSSSYYHSMWLTWGFNIGRTETFVELSNEDKFNI